MWEGPNENRTKKVLYIIRQGTHFLMGPYPSVSVLRTVEECQWGVPRSDWGQMWSFGPQRGTRWTAGAHCCICNLPHSSHPNTKLKTSKHLWITESQRVEKLLNKPARPIRLHQQCDAVTSQQRLMFSVWQVELFQEPFQVQRWIHKGKQDEVSEES